MFYLFCKLKKDTGATFTIELLIVNSNKYRHVSHKASIRRIKSRRKLVITRLNMMKTL